MEIIKVKSSHDRLDAAHADIVKGPSGAYQVALSAPGDRSAQFAHMKGFKTLDAALEAAKRWAEEKGAPALSYADQTKG